MQAHPWFCPLAAAALACCHSLHAASLPAELRPAPAPVYATGGYHGGGLLVTDPRVARGHLAPGQVLPIRLSRLGAPAGLGRPPLGGSEDPASVRYGQLEFLEVSPGRVTFRVAFREPGGGLGQPRTVTVQVGESVDLGGRGLVDLVLDYPAKPLTVKAAEVAYSRLAFRCDAEHTAMFALVPADFPGARYPYGISGVTPSGHFIFLAEGPPARPGITGPAASPGPPADVEPTQGDVVVDLGAGRIRRIEQARRNGEGWDLEYGKARSPYLFQEVFGAAYIHIAGDPDQLARRYGGRDRGRARLDGDPPPDLVVADTTQTLMDNAYGRLDLQVAARLGAGVDFSANINYHGMTAQLEAQVDETLRLAADYRADRPWHQDLGCWTLADPSLGFAVGGIPLSISLPVTAGVHLNGDYTGKALEGLCSAGHWAWTAQLAATWGWRGVEVDAPEPVAHSSLEVDGLPENRSDLAGKLYVRPWVAVTPTFRIAGLLSGVCPSTLSIAGTLPGSGAAPQEAGPEVSAKWELGVGLRLDLPVLGKVWEHDWPVYDWTGIVGPRL